MILVSIYAGLRIFFSPIFERFSPIFGRFSPIFWTETRLVGPLPRITGAEWLLARTSTHPTILRLFSDYSKTA